MPRTTFTTLISRLLIVAFAVGGIANCSSTTEEPLSPASAAQDDGGPGSDDGDGRDGGDDTADDAAIPDGHDASSESCADTCKGCCDGETCIKTTDAANCGARGKTCTSCAASMVSSAT